MISVLLNRNQLTLLVIFFACILSRLLSSIYYIEDIDSLRFALSLYEYSILNLQPHFPGYPVFCFIVKSIYFFTANMGAAFSLVGGISTFVIVYFCLFLANTDIKSTEGAFLAFIIFFNPMLWIMGNRYMPDLMGFAIALSVLYIFILPYSDKNRSLFGYFLSGLLCGTRLSYMPLITIPFIKNLQEGNAIKKISFFILGLSIWLLPLIFVEGFNNLITSAKKQTIGHFTDFGGTAITDTDWTSRFFYFTESIWADGLGGYWLGRSWQTAFFSIFLLSLFAIGIYTIIKNWKHEKYLRRIVRSVALYFVWILVFQNVIYKSRHVLPILLIFFIILSIGLEFIINKKSKTLNVIAFIFCISLVQITGNLVLDHKKPTAVSQLKDDILLNNNYSTIISTPLINYYLESHQVKSRFINATSQQQVDNFLENSFDENVLIVGNYTAFFKEKYSVKREKIFYHNPYINRMWAKIETFSLQLN